MNRRGFFTFLGAVAGLAVVAPCKLLEAAEPKPVFRSYQHSTTMPCEIVTAAGLNAEWDRILREADFSKLA